MAARCAADNSVTLADLRHRMARVERRWRHRGESGEKARAEQALSIGDADIDAHLRGAPLHGVHAVAPIAPADGSEAAGFALRLAIRCARQGPRKTLLWASAPRARSEHGRLYGPGLQSCGGEPGAILLAALARDRDVLAALEEAGRAGALAAACGEAPGGDLTAMRRLALAAAEGATPIFLAMPWRAADQAVGAATRWRVGAAASGPHDEDPFAPGPPRFATTLSYARGGRPGSWTTEWDDEAHALRMVSELADAEAPPSRQAHGRGGLRASG